MKESAAILPETESSVSATPSSPMDSSAYFDAVKHRTLPVIVDDLAMIPLVEKNGFQAVHFDQFDFHPEAGQPALMLIAHHTYHRQLKELWTTTPHILSHLTLAKFDNSIDCVKYTFERFLEIDFHGTLARRQAYYEQLFGCTRLEVETAGGVLSCHFNDEVEAANLDTNLEPGWLYSAAEFFEASIINLQHERSSYRLEGPFRFDGLIYLFNNPAMALRCGPTLELFVRHAVRGNNTVWFADNRVSRLVLGGVDLTEAFEELVAGREREGASTECAFGCVDSVQAPDWQMNSLINESVHGVHVGVGMGREIPHIDFIARTPSCRFLSSPRASE